MTTKEIWKGSYNGQVLRIDLTARSSTMEPLGENLVSRFIGGECLGAAILYRELKPHIDPLSPENKLISYRDHH